MTQDETNMEAKYESDDGRVITRANIGWAVRFENADVEPADDGFIVDGEHYRRVE